MKTIDECLDDLMDDDSVINETDLEFCDAEATEGVKRAMVNSLLLKDDHSLLIFAKSYANMLNEALRNRASDMKEKSITPWSFDNRGDYADFKREELA